MDKAQSCVNSFQIQFHVSNGGRKTFIHYDRYIFQNCPKRHNVEIYHPSLLSSSLDVGVRKVGHYYRVETRSKQSLWPWTPLKTNISDVMALLGYLLLNYSSIRYTLWYSSRWWYWSLRCSSNILYSLSLLHLVEIWISLSIINMRRACGPENAFCIAKRG